MSRNNVIKFGGKNLRYRFKEPGVEDSDIDFICSIIDKRGLTPCDVSQLVAKASGGAANVSRSTIARWLDGVTKKPQNFTTTWVAYALGWRRVWQAF